MSNDLAPVRFFLPNGETDALDSLCVNSFLAQGHPCHIYSYQTSKTPIANCSYRDADSVLKEGLYRTIHHENDYARRWFQWELAAQDAGWICSTDMFCLKPLTFNVSPVFAYADGNQICDDLFYCSPEHNIVRALLRRYRHPEYFPLDSMRKLRALISALFTLSSGPLRSTDARWLHDNTYLSFRILTHKISLKLLAPYFFTPWKAEYISRYIRQDSKEVGAHTPKIPIGLSYAVKLHRRTWQNTHAEIAATSTALTQLQELLGTNST